MRSRLPPSVQRPNEMRAVVQRPQGGSGAGTRFRHDWIGQLSAEMGVADAWFALGAGSVLTHRADPASPYGRAIQTYVMPYSIVKVERVPLTLAWICQPFSQIFDDLNLVI
jgi:hypothetical protein